LNCIAFTSEEVTEIQMKPTKHIGDNETFNWHTKGSYY